MKIAFFTDPHITEKLSLLGANKLEAGQATSLNDAARDLADIIETSTARRIEHIVCGGDLFDRGEPTPAEVSVALEALSGAPHIHFYLVRGNHDMAGRDRRNGLDAIAAANLSNVTIFNDPTWQMIAPGVCLHVLPYPKVITTGEGREADNAANSRMLDGQLEQLANSAERRPDVTHILVSHVTWAGTKMHGREIAHDVIASKTRLTAFNAVIAGHIHKREELLEEHDFAWYIGTPNRQSFSDEGRQVGWLTLRVNPDDSEAPVFPAWTRNRRAREWVTLKPSEFTQYEPPTDADEAARVFLRVRGELDTSAELDALQARAKILRAAVGGLRVDARVRRSSETLPVVEDRSDISAIFDAYNANRPHAIPEAQRAAVLARAERAVAGVQP